MNSAYYIMLCVAWAIVVTVAFSSLPLGAQMVLSTLGAIVIYFFLKEDL